MGNRNDSANIAKSERWVSSEQIVPPKSISDQIYDLLKEKILENEIKPGERLMQEEIAEVFKASRTPIRQVFLLLEKDGLVERLPQGGVRVTQIDIATVKDVFGIRGVLEAYAVELACARIHRQETDQMREIERQAHAILSSTSVPTKPNYLRLLELNISFHDVIYKATGSRLLAKMINNLRATVHRFRLISMRQTETWNQVWKEHSQILSCLERRDKETACRVMREHISAAASYVVAKFQRNEFSD
jgi:GntR family transcriptional regulator, rspAB operon transcriptional repressor